MVHSKKKFLSLRRSGWKLLFSLVVLCFPLIVLSDGRPDSLAVSQCPLPADYGKVICQYNEESPNQLYIIAMSHRDTLTGLNDRRTSHVQGEVYKIGEWLIQNKGVELILPEGFFAGNQEKVTMKNTPEQISGSEKRVPDLNAETQLGTNFPLVMKQVEDMELYMSVNKGIHRLAQTKKGDVQQIFLIRSELDYHQKKRVGCMLQKIPQVVDESFRQGQIHSKTALFTIGLSHIPSIIRYLNQKKISVLSPPFISTKFPDYVDDLNLTKEKFGICVILPRALIAKHKTLENVL